MGSLADTTVRAADPMHPVPYRVVASVPETDDVRTLTLAPEREVLPAVRPGQFLMVWSFGVGEIPVSVSGTGPGGEVLLTVRAVGATSAAIDGTAVGDVLGVRGPYGTAWPVERVAGRDVVVVAGGLGLAPLRMAIDALVTGTTSVPSRVSVVVGARMPAQLLYPTDMERWAAAGAHVSATVDAADRSWHGAVGTATAHVQRLGARHDVAFVCGPELMVTSAARAAITMGVLPGDVWVSLERNMHCGVGQCGRCQLGSLLLCRDGAVVNWADVNAVLEVKGR